MESHSLKLPEIPSSEQTPLVQRLLQIILEQQKRIEQLEEEVQRLKGVTVKPKIKPSRLEQGRTSQEEAGESGRAKPGPKRSKTQTLEIHHTEIVEAEEVPDLQGVSGLCCARLGYPAEQHLLSVRAMAEGGWELCDSQGPRGGSLWSDVGELHPLSDSPCKPMRLY
jgi:hypothetical protein